MGGCSIASEDLKHSLTEPEGEGDLTVENVPDARVILAEDVNAHSVNNPARKPDATARTRTGWKYRTLPPMCG